MSIIHSIFQFIADHPIYVAANILIFLGWCIFMDTVLERRRKLSVVILVHFIMTCVYFIPCALPYKSIISFFILVFALTFQALFLYEGKLQRKLIVVVIDMLTMLIAELVNLYFFYDPQFVQGGAMTVSTEAQLRLYSVYLFVNFAILGTAAVIMKRSDDKRKYPLSYSLVVIIPFAIEIFLIYSWFKTLLGDDPAQTGALLVVIFICLLGNSAVFYAVALTQKRNELKTENASLETLVKAQEDYYSALTRQYESIRKMRHDIANHMYTINILLEDGKADEAAEYAKELSAENCYAARFGECQNHVLDAFLRHRIDEFAAKGIMTDVKIALPQDLDISNCDLISLFGNLLDNAAEACAAVDSPKIFIVSELRGNYMYVSVENPLTEAPEAKERRIPELERGLGNKILKGLAEKYDGEFNNSVTDSIYSATILLKAFTPINV